MLEGDRLGAAPGKRRGERGGSVAQGSHDVGSRGIACLAFADSLEGEIPQDPEHKEDGKAEGKQEV